MIQPGLAAVVVDEVGEIDKEMVAEVVGTDTVRLMAGLLCRISMPA